MAIPFLRALRTERPDDRLAVLARRGPAAILRAFGGSDGGIDVIERPGGLVADAGVVRGRGLTEAWLLPNSFRAALLAFASGARERIGYDTDRRGFLLTRAVARPPARSHQLRDYDRLLASRGIQPDFDPPRLTVPEAAQRRADEALARAGVGGAFVMLAPGAAFAWTKRWPAERFGALAASLAERGTASAIAIGPGEEGIAAAVVAAAAGAPVPVLGADLDPLELAGALARAQTVVANDSGPMHLSAAVGTPVVALFGPTDPGRTAPTGAPSRVLDRYVFCSPCFKKECPFQHECLRDISAEEVLRAVMDLNRETRNPGAPDA